MAKVQKIMGLSGFLDEILINIPKGFQNLDMIFQIGISILKVPWIFEKSLKLELEIPNIFLECAIEWVIL